MDAEAEVAVELALADKVIAWVLAGAALGTMSGLVPGLHANNFALLLAGVALSVPGPPLLVGSARLAAGVVHTLLNMVPAMALGVPGAEMAVTALPGHRLYWRGYEAIWLSALGSVLAVIVAVPFAVPVEPDCPECGWILPEHWRLDHDRSRWECRHCRMVFHVAEVLRA